MIRAIPTAQSILVALGPHSPTFRRAILELTALFDLVKEIPEVAVRYREWQRYQPVAYRSAVGAEELFLRHTYLSLIARLIARFFLGPGFMPNNLEHLRDTIAGDYFREQEFDNFIEDDFFTWLLFPTVAEKGLNLMARLGVSLSGYDFRQADPDLLAGLYDQFTDPELLDEPMLEGTGRNLTPKWLAEYLLGEELELSEHPDQRVLDPCCGPGTFLSAAIRIIASDRTAQGEDQFEVLLHVLDQVMGMDPCPLAVSVARTSYLLALGNLVTEVHPPVLLPVYLSNAIDLPSSAEEPGNQSGNSEPVYTFETNDTGVTFRIPETVAANLVMLNWLFDRLRNYLNGAQLRSLGQDQEEAVQAVLNAFHNYLVASKPRTPIPEPLSAFAAEVMVDTAASLLRLYLETPTYLWLHILKNAPASVHMAQRKFDLVVGNPPWAIGTGPCDSKVDHTGLASIFFTQCARLYLKDPGRIGMIMPRALVFPDCQHRLAPFPIRAGSSAIGPERVVDLGQLPSLFTQPGCLLIATASVGDTPTISVLTLRGTPPERNATWEEVSGYLERSVVIVDSRGDG